MEYTPENVATLKTDFESNLKEFSELCKTLEDKKAEIDTCKKSLQEFKAKGMNVDSALEPLENQQKEVTEKLNKFVSTLDGVKSSLVALVSDMKN